MEFELKSEEYIELNRLLKLMRLTGSGGESNMHITNGEVLVNDKIEVQKRKKLRVGDTVTFNSTTIFIK